jgi:hypothetical protein
VIALNSIGLALGFSTLGILRLCEEEMLQLWRLDLIKCSDVFRPKIREF